MATGRISMVVGALANGNVTVAKYEQSLVYPFGYRVFWNRPILAFEIIAIAPNIPLPRQITKTFSPIGRTPGAIAHIAEEIKNPMATNIDASIKANLQYQVDGKP